MEIEITDNISDEAWDEFLKNSLHGSVYSQSSFLIANDVPHEKLFLKQKGNVFASALIVEPNSDFKAPYHYSINHSELFADKTNHINGIENFWN